METSGSVSVPAVRQYVRAAEACGVDWVGILAEEVGVPPDLLKDNRQRLPMATVERLLSKLISVSDEPCFGLLTSRFVEPASYSVLGYICLNCTSLRQVLAMIPVYEAIVGDMGVSKTLVQDGHVYQQWHCHFLDPAARRHEVENVLASWYRFSRDYLHVEIPLEAIWLEHSSPERTSERVSYDEAFGCKTVFDQPFNALVFNASLLDLEIPQADPNLLQVLQGHAMQILEDIDSGLSVSSRVCNMLRMTMARERPSSESIADKLGMSSRTLQRKLDQEGCNFQQLLKQVRLDLATHYLKNTGLSIDSIAAQLGFAEARSFHRSFKSWTGITAGAFRAGD